MSSAVNAMDGVAKHTGNRDGGRTLPVENSVVDVMLEGTAVREPVGFALALTGRLGGPRYLFCSRRYVAEVNGVTAQRDTLVRHRCATVRRARALMVDRLATELRIGAEPLTGLLPLSGFSLLPKRLLAPHTAEAAMLLVTAAYDLARYRLVDALTLGDQLCLVALPGYPVVGTDPDSTVPLATHPPGMRDDLAEVLASTLAPVVVAPSAQLGAALAVAVAVNAAAVPLLEAVAPAVARVGLVEDRWANDVAHVAVALAEDAAPPAFDKLLGAAAAVAGER